MHSDHIHLITFSSFPFPLFQPFLRPNWFHFYFTVFLCVIHWVEKVHYNKLYEHELGAIYQWLLKKMAPPPTKYSLSVSSQRSQQGFMMPSHSIHEEMLSGLHLVQVTHMLRSWVHWACCARETVFQNIPISWLLHSFYFLFWSILLTLEGVILMSHLGMNRTYHRPFVSLH